MLQNFYHLTLNFFLFLKKAIFKNKFICICHTKKVLINKEEEHQNIELVSLAVLNANNEQAIGFANKWGELGIFFYLIIFCATLAYCCITLQPINYTPTESNYKIQFPKPSVSKR